MTDLATALLRDVPRFASPDGNLLAEKDVLAALSRALDPAIAERAGEVLEGVTDGWSVYEMPNLKHDANARFIAWCREGVPALLAQIAVLLAERDGWKQWSENWRDSAQRCLAVAEKQEARATAAKAREERLRGALEWYAKDGWNDRSLEPPTPEEVEVFGDNILDFPMPEIFFDRGERARAALTETATTEEGK